MKKLFMCIVLLTYSTIVQSQDTVHVDTSICESPICSTTYPTNITTDNNVSALTLAVNAVNNIFTWSAIIVAILTFVTMIIGFIGYKSLKDKIDHKIEIIDQKLAVIDQCNNELQKLGHKFNIQENFTYKTSEYLYESVEQIVNQMQDERRAKDIYSKLLHSFHITHLYKNADESKLAALFYLHESGTIKDVSDLEYIEKMDENVEYRKRAREIIGVIKHRSDESSDN